jgi:hypothetical protein
MAILMGDFNAKTPATMMLWANKDWDPFMNENGERFEEICCLHQLVIGGIFFPHKRIHKATWGSPDSVSENQTDNICINKQFRRSWKEMSE